jgi:hypothetical protein
MEKVPLPLANPQAGKSDPAQLRQALCLVEAPAILRLWHLTSLDAPTVAVVWTLAFARAAEVQLPAWVPLLIALGTWTVYVGDRLLDSRSSLISGSWKSLRERHLFHWRHRRVFSRLAAITACIAAAIIFGQMPIPVRQRNSVLAVAALTYFSGVHSRRKPPAWLRSCFSKEFFVGTLFTAGCALPTLSRIRTGSSLALSWPLLVSVVFFAALAWLNCHAIERWESQGDSRIFPAACMVALAGILLAASAVFVQPNFAALLAAAAASAILLAVLDHLRTRLTPLALRSAADLVLLTPIFLIPFATHLQ